MQNPDEPRKEKNLAAGARTPDSTDQVEHVTSAPPPVPWYLSPPEVAAMPLTMRVCYYLQPWNTKARYGPKGRFIKTVEDWAERIACLRFWPDEDEYGDDGADLTQKQKEALMRKRALAAHADLLAFVEEQIDIERRKWQECL